MNFNVILFKEFIKKATLNFGIDTIKIDFTKDIVKSCMISEDRRAVTDIKIKNDILEMNNIMEEYEFPFNQIKNMVMPILNLIDSGEAEIEIDDKGVTILNGKQKSRLFFCSPEIVSVFDASNGTVFDNKIVMSIDDILDSVIKVKKLGNRFGDHIYFNVSKGKFNIECSDRSNIYSNGLKIDLTDTDIEDFSMKFAMDNFLNLMALVSKESEDFTIEFSKSDRLENMGVIYVEKSDQTEKYYLSSSKMENEI